LLISKYFLFWFGNLRYNTNTVRNL